MTQLRACDACSRHVFVTESSCPFCGAQLTAAPRARALPIFAGMSRAQRMAIAAAAVASQAAVGCSQPPVPHYGAPPIFEPDAAADAAQPDAGAAKPDASMSTSEPPDAGGGAIPIYGASPNPGG